MKVCVGAVLLLVFGLSWTRSEPSPAPGSEECNKMNTPLSLDDKTPVLGRFNFLMGFTDETLYRTLLGLTSSFWYNVTETSTGLGMLQFNKMNGTCLSSTTNVTINKNTAKVSLHNMSSEFQFIRSSEDSVILNIHTSSPNIHSFLQKLNIDPTTFNPKLSARSFYFMSRGPIVKDSDLEQFKVQAHCAGFNGEPDFIHDPKNEFCSEEESVLMVF